jgi:hypothetical protein
MKRALAVGDSRHYVVYKITPRHFVQTAAKSGIPLPADTSAVFLLGCGSRDHRADPRLASVVCKQRTNQRFAVDPVGLARRRRRDVAIEAGSTTWLSIPSDCSTRWIQKPSSPASWMTINRNTSLVRARAFCLG